VRSFSPTDGLELFDLTVRPSSAKKLSRDLERAEKKEILIFQKHFASVAH
jgi:hypothetical protein